MEGSRFMSCALVALLAGTSVSVAQVSQPPAATVPTTVPSQTGQAWNAPGMWPNRVTGAAWTVTTPPGGVLDGVGSNYLDVSIVSGPVKWTTGWSNEGDVDANIGPFEPLNPLSYPDDPFYDSLRREAGVPAGSRSGDWGRLELSDGLPTQSWSLNPAIGVVLMTTRVNGRDNENTVFGLPVGTHYGVVQPVAEDFRSGRAYHMVDGEHRNGGGTIYLSMNMLGFGEETNLDFAAGWFPYSEGWIGGYASTSGLQFDDVPDFSQYGNLAFTVPGDLYPTINLASTSGAFAGSGLEDNLGAVFEGQVTLGGGEYTFYTESDDGSYLDVFTGGQWVQVVDNGGTHGMIEEIGVITLAAGTYDVRVRFYERGGGAGLIVQAEGADLGAKAPLLFDGTGATATYYDFSFDASNPRWANSLGVTAATAGLDPEVASWIPDSPGGSSYSFAQSRIELPGITPQDGMVFTNSTNSSNDTVITNLLPDATGWTMQGRRDSDLDTSGQTLSELSSGRFAFVYVPFDSNNLVGAHIEGGTGSTINGAGAFTLNRTGEGTYSLDVGKTGDEGVLLLQVAGSIPGDPTLADRTTLSYEYDETTMTFEIQSRELTTGGNVFGEDAPLRDSDFYFVWIDFSNPLSPPDFCEADCDGSGALDIFDFLCFQDQFTLNTAYADFNGDSVLDIFDFLGFQDAFAVGCP